MSQTTDAPSNQTSVEPSYKIGSLASMELDGDAVKQGGQGALSKSFVAKGKNQLINIRYDYPWTLTDVKTRSDIPTIILTEYKQLEGSLKEQLNLFGEIFANKVGFEGSFTTPTEIYDSIWQKTEQTRTGFKYMFPYFNDIAYSMGTAPWQQLDDIGPKIGEAINEGAGALGDLGMKSMKRVEQVIKGGMKLGSMFNALGDAALKYRYPSVGVADRPKVFAGHTPRQITIDFPLFNTIKKNDWKKNLDFIQLFANENLFNKRDFITGIPPVWYEVRVPGQYYCWAACVTDFTVKNLGNIHAVGNTEWNFGLNVPDAYQVTITLQEMTQPSKNQFSEVINVSKTFTDTQQ